MLVFDLLYAKAWVIPFADSHTTCKSSNMILRLLVAVINFFSFITAYDIFWTFGLNIQEGNATHAYYCEPDRKSVV